MVCADLLHLNQASVEVRRSSVQLLAVVLRVVVVALRITCHDGILVQVRELVDKFPALWVVGVILRIEEEGMLLDGQRDRLRPRLYLDQIRSVCASTPVPSVAIWVGIGTCPLKMEQGALLNNQVLWHEVVLHGRVDLDDVPPSPSHVVVHDALVRKLGGALHYNEGVSAILERAAELVGVHLQLQQPAGVRHAFAQAKPVRHGVLGQGHRDSRTASEGPAPAIVRVWVIELPVHEEGVGLDALQLRALLLRVGEGSEREVAGRDVVADSQHNTPLHVVRDLPKVILRVAVADVSVVVVAARNAPDALRRWLIEGLFDNPLPVIAHAGVRVVVQAQGAAAFLLDVLRLRHVVRAALLRLIREDSNVMPRRWVPVGIVVPLLRALEAMALIVACRVVAARILPRSCGASIVLNVLVGREKALVALALIACLVEVQGLVVSPRHFGGLLLCGSVVITAGRVRACAIAQGRIVGFAHVLQDDLTTQVRVPHAAAMLHVPVDVQLRALVELHGTQSRPFHRYIIVVVPVLTGRLAIVADLIA
mmetsp:Transcript_7474/g.13029  ORF Transcript_7474/g.13029 Transcript_7474/m.13029 type:complete len:538 (-) Transcript_7474:219-1832(-)